MVVSQALPAPARARAAAPAPCRASPRTRPSDSSRRRCRRRPARTALPPRHDDRADRDAEVEVAGEVEIADGAGVEAAPRSARARAMICIARTFGAPDTVPAGKHDDERVEPVAIRRRAAPRRSTSGASRARSARAPMNCGTRTDAVLADAADVVAAEVDEHHVLGALLLVALQLLGQPLVLVRRSRRAAACRQSDASRRARPRRARASRATSRRPTRRPCG